jgi:hypothetical protein
MRMVDILSIHVREWVVNLVAARVSPATIRRQMIILTAVVATASSTSSSLCIAAECLAAEELPITPRSGLRLP